MKKTTIALIVLGLLVLPVLVFAQQAQQIDYANLVPNIMGKIITFVWQFFVGLTVIMFISAGILFVTSSGDPAKIKTARSAFIWGVVGIIVAIVSYSIVKVVRVMIGV